MKTPPRASRSRGFFTLAITPRERDIAAIGRRGTSFSVITTGTSGKRTGRHEGATDYLSSKGLHGPSPTEHLPGARSRGVRGSSSLRVHGHLGGHLSDRIPDGPLNHCTPFPPVRGSSTRRRSHIIDKGSGAAIMDRPLHPCYERPSRRLCSRWQEHVFPLRVFNRQMDPAAHHRTIFPLLACMGVRHRPRRAHVTSRTARSSARRSSLRPAS